MKKVYIIECSSGQYEDCRTWNHSVHKTKADAEKYKKDIDDGIQKIRDSECPVKYEDGSPNEDYMKMNDSDYDKYNKWSSERTEASDFNSATINEYEIGKIFEH